MSNKQPIFLASTYLHLSTNQPCKGLDSRQPLITNGQNHQNVCGECVGGVPFIFSLLASFTLRDSSMGSQSELDRWIEQLKRCEPLLESEVKTLCAWAQDLLVEEGNVQRVDSPVTICG